MFLQYFHPRFPKTWYRTKAVSCKSWVRPVKLPSVMANHPFGWYEVEKNGAVKSRNCRWKNAWWVCWRNPQAISVGALIICCPSRCFSHTFGNTLWELWGTCVKKSEVSIDIGLVSECRWKCFTRKDARCLEQGNWMISKCKGWFRHWLIDG